MKLTAATRGKNCLIRRPMPKKMTIVNNVVNIFRNGGDVDVPSNMVRPSVYSQNGINPIDNIVDRNVIVSSKSNVANANDI
ncbi:hypothetical protein BLA29_003371 [Euroglyphus maynei]|uniref:Uncharacterized protein n=1 Tax=Euroglyphus maynei TaxID=6958 RepID=A0A1Y3BQI6_EURMA|nr:hypothetical protein BLA29_003371 [Euroglyphus maynei]